MQSYLEKGPNNNTNLGFISKGKTFQEAVTHMASIKLTVYHAYFEKLLKYYGII